MRDPITDAAQDPSCLLCLTPDRGGLLVEPFASSDAAQFCG